jgi:hypothetical protein
LEDNIVIILERHKLLRHHSVGSRGISGWLHFAAILIENKSKQQYAVDGWLLASGQAPEITEVEKWYIDDNHILFGNMAPITTGSTQPSK